MEYHAARRPVAALAAASGGDGTAPDTAPADQLLPRAAVVEALRARGIRLLLIQVIETLRAAAPPTPPRPAAGDSGHHGKDTIDSTAWLPSMAAGH